MKTICTNCKGENVYIVTPEQEEKKEEVQTMDDLQRNAMQGISLVYHLTTYRCKDCGYSVSF